MTESSSELDGRDFADGISISQLADGTVLVGHVRGEPALLIRQDNDFYVIGATCTHYGAPLSDGLVVGATVRCPWHHACFSLASGKVLRPPALDPLPCWAATCVDGIVYAGETRRPAAPERTKPDPEAVVIIGGGAAGLSAAETLRREGYEGPITMFSADASLPCDRPNLSKGYLSGAASEESNLLRPPAFFSENRIDVHLNARVARIDPGSRAVELADGSRHQYAALLLATGCEPVRLQCPGADLPHIHYLRTLADARALVAKAQRSRRAVVIGTGFIGLEVASSLRMRGIDVHLVGRAAVPMARTLGSELGAFLQTLHEQHGVVFHMGASVSQIDPDGVRLNSGDRIDADLVVVGVGVQPVTDYAQSAGLVVDDGVVVDAFLETSSPGVFAAGDIARWEDPLSRMSVRIEHFVVAERQGQTAARNMLGQKERYEAVPFFWTEQYDVGIGYVGHADLWDEVLIDGEIELRDCTITYRSRGRTIAVAVIHRDLEGLRAEVAFERLIAGHDCGPIVAASFDSEH